MKRVVTLDQLLFIRHQRGKPRTPPFPGPIRNEPDITKCSLSVHLSSGKIIKAGKVTENFNNLHKASWGQSQDSVVHA